MPRLQMRRLIRRRTRALGKLRNKRIKRKKYPDPDLISHISLNSHLRDVTEGRLRAGLRFLGRSISDRSYRCYRRFGACRDDDEMTPTSSLRTV